jgi:hypothetical protein
MCTLQNVSTFLPFGTGKIHLVRTDGKSAIVMIDYDRPETSASVLLEVNENPYLDAKRGEDLIGIKVQLAEPIRNVSKFLDRVRTTVAQAERKVSKQREETNGIALQELEIAMNLVLRPNRKKVA